MQVCLKTKAQKVLQSGATDHMHQQSSLLKGSDPTLQTGQKVTGASEQTYFV